MSERENSTARWRLLARPAQRREEALSTGLHHLGLDGTRDGFLYVPSSYRADHPAPLVVMLHGAGGNARGGLAPFLELADAHGLLLLAPDSRLQTWDVLRGGYGPDVTFLDQALSQTFKRCAVDPAHLAIEGFSDGASYALSLGLANGELCTHIIAFCYLSCTQKYTFVRDWLFLAHSQVPQSLRLFGLTSSPQAISVPS